MNYIEGTSQSYSCEICAQSLSSEDELKLHVNEVHVEGSVSCPFCDLQDVTADQMSVHINSNHLNDSSGNLNSPTKRCPICSHIEESALDLENHINDKHFRQNEAELCDFVCPMCYERFNGSSELQQHFRSNHEENLTTPQKNSSKSDLLCPVCHKSSFSTEFDLNQHVNGHFHHSNDTEKSDFELAQEIERQERERRTHEEEHEFKKLRLEYGYDEASNYRNQTSSALEKEVYKGNMSVLEYHKRKMELAETERTGVNDEKSSTKNPLPHLNSLIQSLSNVSEFFLCSPLDHISSSYGDKGWGCGYRNLQMLISCLRQNSQYSTAFPAVPSISKLQEMIEESWSAGFDVAGCEQLGGKLRNTRKWIGATEIASLLTFKHIDIQVIDFHRPTGPDGTHPELFKFVLSYFKQKRGTFAPPIYFQHQGHSRTIVGFELLKNGQERLLIFDPSHLNMWQLSQPNRDRALSVLRSLRKYPNQIKSEQYQLVIVNGILGSGQDVKSRKVIRSLRIPN